MWVAHHYVDSAVTDIAKALQERVARSGVLVPASGGKRLAAAVKGLRTRRRVISLGATDEPSDIADLFQRLITDVFEEPIGSSQGVPIGG